ncbi:MAG TPA: flagellar assembly peptidoglycan hydrolase FlgJ [Chromatiaceae bacterium]|jgi:flagellar protein FlgJ|nr:flagellar assembly peptidoglycan hydrolase FlgJ [Chromatiaceae bacterium]
MSVDVSATDVYTDFSGFAALKAQAREHSPEAIKQVAKQFEGLMLQMMLKSMRDANLGDGLFDSDQVQASQDMYDKQLAISLAARGDLGLAQAIVRQLSGDTGIPETSGKSISGDSPVASIPFHNSDIDTDTVAMPAPVAAHDEHDSPESFVRAVWDSATRAAQKLGTDTEVLVAQAALETGWGESIKHSHAGNNSHNLFSIKADQRWSGPTVRINTLEFEDGIAVQKQADFRAYASYDEAFDDYVHFIQGGERYGNAVAQAAAPAAYVDALQDAGYATDPAYASKILRVMNGDTLKNALDSLNKEVS